MSAAADELEETQITVLDLPLEFKVSDLFFGWKYIDDDAYSQ